MEKRLSGGRPWGGQSQCASPAREDRGNLTRPVATNSGTNLHVQTPRRRSQQQTPKSRKERPATLTRQQGESHGRPRRKTGHSIGMVRFSFARLVTEGDSIPPSALRPNHVSSVAALWPDAVWMLSGCCPSPVPSASSETPKLA